MGLMPIPVRGRRLPKGTWDLTKLEFSHVVRASGMISIKLNRLTIYLEYVTEYSRVHRASGMMSIKLDRLTICLEYSRVYRSIPF